MTDTNKAAQRKIAREVAQLQVHIGGLAEVVSFGSSNGGLTARFHMRSAGRMAAMVPNADSIVRSSTILSIPALRRQVARAAGSIRKLSDLLSDCSGERLDLLAESERVAAEDEREKRIRRDCGEDSDGEWMRGRVVGAVEY